MHGIAFAPELKRGFTSNGRANTVSAFALDSLQTIQESPVAGKKPDAILYEPRFQHVFTADGASDDIDVLDPMTLQVVEAIALPGPPEFMATDGAGTVFVNIENEAAKLVAIDARTFKVKAAWNLPGCSRPTGLAIDAENHRLFSVCENRVMAVTDSASGKQVALVPIGAGPDAAAFDRDLGYVFASNGIDGTLTVIHQDAAGRGHGADPAQRADHGLGPGDAQDLSLGGHPGRHAGADAGRSAPEACDRARQLRDPGRRTQVTGAGCGTRFLHGLSRMHNKAASVTSPAADR